MRQSQTFSRRSSLLSRLFRIGKDSRGNWVVQGKRGLRGGLFVNRASALKFALFENGDRPELVITVPGVFELDMSGNAFAAQPSATYVEPSLAHLHG